MLEIIKMRRRQEAAKLFRKVDFTKATWMVSNLRSKLELQQTLLTAQDFYLDNSVLRASDFWKKILRLAQPQIKVISVDFAKLILRNFFREQSKQLQNIKVSENILIPIINQLVPMFVQDPVGEKVQDWFEQNPKAEALWKEWYLLARLGFQHLTQEHQSVLPSWIPAFLSAGVEIEKYWHRKLYVDLSSEISLVEAELITRLSRYQDVCVLMPAYESFRFKSYEYLLAQSSRVTQSEEEPEPKKLNTFRYSGMLAEIKQAVSQCRIWLDQGVKPGEVAIISPEIEEYWPVLRSFLEKEGIPFQKDLQLRLNAFPCVSQWMARLRLEVSTPHGSDLETDYYRRPLESRLDFETFHSLFVNLYEKTDLNRHEKIKEIYSQGPVFKQQLTRDEFLATAIYFWSDPHKIDLLQLILREVLAQEGENLRLAPQDWFSYIEQIAAKKEKIMHSGHPSGLQVSSLMSGHAFDITHRIFLGLSEEFLRNKNRSLIPSEDIAKVSKDLGFYLEDPDKSFKNYELQWMAQNSGQQDIFCFGDRHLNGTLLTPASFWLSHHLDNRGKENLHSIDLPGSTRWDEIFNSTLNPKFKRALQEVGENLPLIVEVDKITLTPSLLQEYLKCPFKWASSYYFKLRDLPEIDVDVDARTRGNLYHSLFYELTECGLLKNLSAEEISDILEKIRQKENLIFSDERMWQVIKRKAVQVGRRFLQFEQDWHQKFPETRVRFREQTWKMEWSDQISISGRIDRVDADENNNFILIDYKSSPSQAQNYPNWLKEKNLQLLFYMWALEKEGKNVVGAFFYVFKNFKRDFGFQIKDFEEQYFPRTKKRTLSADKEIKRELLQTFEELMNTTIGQMSSGIITPKPYDAKECQTCNWSPVCRTTHL